MNIQQLDRVFTEISKKHHVTTFVVMESLTVLGLINEVPLQGNGVRRRSRARKGARGYCAGDGQGGIERCGATIGDGNHCGRRKGEEKRL